MKAKDGKRFHLDRAIFVAAIISLLAAIPFRSFPARENVRRASCQSNLKQPALATFQEAEDNDNKLTDVTANAMDRSQSPTRSILRYLWSFLKQSERHFEGSNYACLDGHVKHPKEEVVDSVYTAQGSDGTGITGVGCCQSLIVFVWKR